MAIYQFVIELIPEAWAKKNCLSDLYDGEFYEPSLAWSAYQPTANFKKLLDNILPRGKSWNENLEVWGDEERTDIQIRFEEGFVDSIKIRLDLRGDISDLMLKIIHLAKELNCRFFLPNERKIIDPNFPLLDQEVSQSNAAKFINDPRKFFEGLRKEKP